jgi:hypothetical protein
MAVSSSRGTLGLDNLPASARACEGGRAPMSPRERLGDLNHTSKIAISYEKIVVSSFGKCNNFKEAEVWNSYFFQKSKSNSKHC